MPISQDMEKISERNAKMIFLSKDGQDEYVNLFAQGCRSKATSTDNFDYDSSNDPIVLRGILKKKIIHKCWKDARTFYYMDTGYFGNEKTVSNSNGWKYWHRIVKNDLQHGEIIKRPDDRFKHFHKKFKPWNKDGKAILIAMPDEKPCRFYGIELEKWLEETVNIIKQNTDRPIVVRQRAAKRIDRVSTDTLEQALAKDVFALVTFNSVAAVESIFQGIPAFTTAPSNAASPVALQDLTKIENPYYPVQDKLYAWGCHLAYGQFHVSELKTGKAKDMLLEL